MAREIPSAPKVYTTVYENFKGVDYTNDATNVWRRRSPTGVNMLPDASGRPFKRHGWEVLVSNSAIADKLAISSYEAATISEDDFNADKELYYTKSGDDYIQCTDADVYDAQETYYVYLVPNDLEIWKCAYFELAGVDHIVIFTSYGVIFYNGNMADAIVNKDAECFSNYERCFFFEGNGVSAFYIYGNYRVWRYEYTTDFVLTEVTSSLTIPTVMTQTSAYGYGTSYQGYNLLGQLIQVDYNAYSIFTHWGSTGLSYTLNSTTFQNATGSAKGNPAYYKWRYTSSNTWSMTQGSVAFADAGITVTTTSSHPVEGDEICVVWANGVILPNNLDVTTQGSQVRVWQSNSKQFDSEMTQTGSTPSTNQYRVHEDDVTPRTTRRAWIEFNKDKVFSQPVAGEDFIRVRLPSTEVKIIDVGAKTASGTATVVGTVV